MIKRMLEWIEQLSFKNFKRNRANFLKFRMDV